MSYDPDDLSCEGCRIRNENISMLLEGILKLGIADGLLRADLTLEEFTGPHALQVLEDMRGKHAITLPRL
jgi:hypothetical protein